MRFRWIEYCDLADQLVDCALHGATEEARYRAAISRYYYAFHKLFYELAETLTPTPVFETDRDKMGKNHRLLWEYFEEKANQFRGKPADRDRFRRLRDIASDLRSLHNNRIEADYEKEIQDSRRLATASQSISKGLKASYDIERYIQ